MNCDAVILLDKQVEITSQTAITQIKRKFKLKKIGHCGTLDPKASGLLICLTGKLTKLAQYIEGEDKIYSGSILLGKRTTTDDLEGEVIFSSDSIPDIQSCQDIIQKKFIGLIDQVPPQYSAIKVEGKRAYQIARSGESSDLKSRQVKIKKFEIYTKTDNEISFLIECTKGTYIRSLARDIGQELGCGACLSSLRREVSVPFNVLEAKKIDALSEGDFLGWISLFPDHYKLLISEHDCRRLKDGNKQTLQNLNDKFSKDFRNLRYVVYYEETTNKPLGLLINNATNLEFGFCIL